MPVRQRHTQAIRIRPIHRVLEERERGLRGQIPTLDRISATEQLLDRVGSQSARIVATWIAACDGIEPLAHQIPDGVTDLAALTQIPDATDQRIGRLSRRSTACRRTEQRRNWHDPDQTWR